MDYLEGSEFIHFGIFFIPQYIIPQDVIIYSKNDDQYTYN